MNYAVPSTKKRERFGDVKRVAITMDTPWTTSWQKINESSGVQKTGNGADEKGAVTAKLSLSRT